MKNIEEKETRRKRGKMYKIFIEEKPGRLDANVFIMFGNREYYQVMKPFKFELSQRYRPDQSDTFEPTLKAPLEDLTQLYKALGEQLTRLGYVKPHPSQELLAEKDAQIAYLKTLVDQGMKNGIAGRWLNVEKTTQL